MALRCLLATTLDKLLVRKLYTWGASTHRSCTDSYHPPPLFPLEATLNWGRGLSLRRVIDLETGLLR